MGGVGCELRVLHMHARPNRDACKAALQALSGDTACEQAEVSEARQEGAQGGGFGLAVQLR